MSAWGAIEGGWRAGGLVGRGTDLLLDVVKRIGGVDGEADEDDV